MTRRSLKRVLLVEDQNGFMTQMILEGYGGMVITLSKRGDEAIELFAATPFDGVLLDLRLPVLDGFTVLQALQKIEPSVPVVILSANGDSNSRERAERLGASGFYQKPPDYLKVWYKISGLMAQSQVKRFDTMSFLSDNPARLAKMRRLLKLKEQAARTGINTPPEVLTEIEDLEAELN